MSTQSNWYAILNVSSNASKTEIKKSYRKLALQYHPDKNNGNHLYAAKFQLIKEAYEVLISDSKRALFDKTYFNTQNNSTKIIFHSSEELLDAAKNLNNKISLMNLFFIDRDWLESECNVFISPENKQIIINDLESRKRILNEQMKVIQLLKYEQSINITKHWQELCKKDPQLMIELNGFKQEILIKHLWERYKIVIAIFVGIITTILIISQ